MGYLKQLGIAADQALNALTGGWADETLSSRIWRNAMAARPKRHWRVLYVVVNSAFFWQVNHCRGAYHAERRRRHSPPSLRL